MSLYSPNITGETVKLASARSTGTLTQTLSTEDPSVFLQFTAKVLQNDSCAVGGSNCTAMENYSKSSSRCKMHNTSHLDGQQWSQSTVQMFYILHGLVWMCETLQHLWHHISEGIYQFFSPASMWSPFDSIMRIFSSFLFSYQAQIMFANDLTVLQKYGI